MRRLGKISSVAGKVFLSVLAVYAFVYFGLKMPALHRSAVPISWDAPAGNNLTAGTVIDTLHSTALGDIEFASDDDLFSGSFYLAEQDMGFETREVATEGPCEGAGLRYIEKDCPDCMITEMEALNGQPSTVYWMKNSLDEAGVSGTIYRDCAASNDNGTVTVPMLSFNSDSLALANTAPRNAASAASPVPLIDGHTRVSAMSLGDWSIAVDSVKNSNGALAAMESELFRDGWVRTSTGDAPVVQYIDQRVYKRSPIELCVVSLTQDEGEYQLITMTNAQ